MQKENKEDLLEKVPAYDIETLIRQYGNDVLRIAYMYVRILIQRKIFSRCIY